MNDNDDLKTKETLELREAREALVDLNELLDGFDEQQAILKERSKELEKNRAPFEEARKLQQKKIAKLKGSQAKVKAKQATKPKQQMASKVQIDRKLGDLSKARPAPAPKQPGGAASTNSTVNDLKAIAEARQMRAQLDAKQGLAQGAFKRATGPKR